MVDEKITEEIENAQDMAQHGVVLLATRIVAYKVQGIHQSCPLQDTFVSHKRIDKLCIYVDTTKCQYILCVQLLCSVDIPPSPHSPDWMTVLVPTKTTNIKMR